MILRELLTYLPKALAVGNLDQVAKAVTADSRQVKAGSIFVAIRGDESDGHRFIDAALKKGAVAIVAERAAADDYAEKAVWIHAAETRKVLSKIASAMAGDPSAELKVVGVTGTNGKTTTTFLLHHIMRSAWMRSGLVGTIKLDNGLHEKDACHTTPSAEVLHGELAEMREHGCRGVALEVSSHGIAQSRSEAVKFDAAIFTNLSQDHLDYHGSMEAYYEVKKSLFTGLAEQEGKKRPVAVINHDDRYGEKLVKELGDMVTVVTYGMGAHCDFKVSRIRQNIRGTEFQLDNRGKTYLVRMPLIGRFNVYNAVAAIAGASVVGIKPRDAVKALAEAPQVPGRLEMVGAKEGATVFVDYAHTPDALENVCATLRDLEPNKLITVFGCGGDRDKSKRPLMGGAASEGSDICLITSDNPRSEDPEQIIKEIEVGMKNKAFRAITDREEAIRTAVNLAGKGDVVLIAGKGHEDYQEFATETIDFDDRKVARWALRDKPVAKLPKKEFVKKEGFRRDRDDQERPQRQEGEKPEYQRPEKYGERRVGEKGAKQRGERGSDRNHKRPRRDDRK